LTQNVSIANDGSSQWDIRRPEKCFETSSRSEEASQTLIISATKNAAGEGNVETVKQLTWASLKFRA